MGYLPREFSYLRVTRSVFLSSYDKMLGFLVEARKAAGTTQVELSKRLNRPQSYVSKFENGDRRIDLVEFIEICVALDTDPLPIVQAVWASMSRF